MRVIRARARPSGRAGEPGRRADLFDVVAALPPNDSPDDPAPVNDEGPRELERAGVVLREALEGALEALDPKPPGRPAKEQMDTRAKELVALQNLVSELTIELEASRVRTELALTMPHVLKAQGNTLGKGGSPNVERWLKVVKDLANDERHDT